VAFSIDKYNKLFLDMANVTEEVCPEIGI